MIGVVADVKHQGLDAAVGDLIYRPYDQEAFRQNLALLVRTSGDPAAMAAAVQESIWRLDPEVPVLRVSTLDRIVRESQRHRRFVASLLVTAGGLALLLAAVGVYGVMSYGVSRRTREIGIRMALGASRKTVLLGILSGGARAALAGITVGLLGAVAVNRALSTLLFEVGPGDPPVLLAVSLFLGAVALLASWLPARRAARVDPMLALRTE